VYREEPFPSGPASLVSVRADGSGAPLELDTALNRQVVRFAIDATSTRVVYVLQAKLWSVPIDGSGAPVQLGPVVAGEGVSSFQLTQDGAGVVFQAGLGTTHLYAGPIDGSAPAIWVSATGGTAGLSLSQEAYAVTPDGAHVLFLADLGVDEKFQLYRAPLDASEAPARVSHALTVDRDVALFRLAPDGRRIAYISSREGDFEGLYLTNVDGSLAPVRLDSPEDDPILFPPPTFTPDSEKLVYKLFENGTQGRLFMVEVAKVRAADGGGPRRLDTPLTPAQVVSNFSLSSSGAFVLYQTNAGSFAVPIRGGAPVALTPAFAPGGSAGQSFVGAGDRGYLLARLDGLAGLSLFSQELTDGVLDGPLDGPLVFGPPTGRVSTYAATPADEVLFVANQVQSGPLELFRVPVDGSAAPVRLSGAMGPDGSLGNTPGILSVSADGERFAYIADQVVNQRNDLYAGPVDGSSEALAIAVPPAGVGGGVEPGMLFTPDGTRLVFRSRHVSSSHLELFSVLSDGSAPPEPLNEPTSSSLGMTVEADLALTSDGARVLYRSDEMGFNKAQLFSVPTDGSTTRLRLNEHMASTREVTAFRLGADSSTVVYLADRDVEDRFELYHVTATGGTVTALDPPTLATTDVTQFELTADAQRVVYRADRALNEQHELWSVPSTGGTSARLNGALVTGGDVGFEGFWPGIALTPDGARVLFLADASADEAFELHAAPVDGSAPALRVSSTLLASSSFDSFTATPDSRHVVFLARETLADPERVYVAPLDASAPPRALPQPVDHSAIGFELDPAGLFALVVSRDPLVFASHALQRVPLAGGRAEPLLEDSGWIEQLGFTAPPGRGLFLADRDDVGVLELFSVRLPRLPRKR